MPRRQQSSRTSGTQFRHPGKPSGFTCPDCEGALFVLKNSGLKRFRCRTGHTYSPESMLEAQSDNVERIMWSAVRALDEHAEYIHQILDQIARADAETAQGYKVRGRTALHSASIIRKLVTRGTEDRESLRAK